MKLLVISWQPLSPVNSGYRRRVTELYTELSHWVEVRVLTPSRSAGHPWEIGVPFPSTWRSRLPKGKVWETFSPLFRRGVEETIREWKPDLVLAEGLWAAWAGREAARQVRAPFGVTVQNIESESAKGVYPFPIPQCLRSYEKRVYGRSDWLVCITEEESGKVRSLLGEKAPIRLIVPNGTTPPAGDPDPEKVEQIRKTWGVAPDESVVFFAGRLDYPPNRLGLEWISQEVCPLMTTEVSRVRWIVAGEPIPEPPLSPFEYAGFAPDLDAACAAATVGISPIFQGSGTSVRVLDFLARGVPMVVTRKAIRGLGESVEDAVIVTDSPGDFAQSLSDLLRNGDRRRQLAQKGKQWAKENAGWSRIAERFAEDLSNLLGPIRGNEEESFS